MGGFAPVGYGAGGGTVTAVTATPPMVSTGGATPNLSTPNANTGSSGLMSAAAFAALAGLDAVLSGSGSGAGELTNTAALVTNQIATGNGVQTLVATAQTVGATTQNIDYPVPNNTAGKVDVIITAADATDGASVTWTGKLLNLAGTITAIKALAAVDTWDTSAGASSWPAPSVSVAGSGVQVQVTGVVGSTITWTVAFQWVSSPT